jgi:hypothetical protein
LAPTLSLPTNASVIDSLTPNLVVTVSSGRFVTVSDLLYRFTVETSAGAELYRSEQVTFLAGTSVPAQRVPAGILASETTYRWRARAEQGTAVGPWSGYWTFTTPAARISPDQLPSYIRSNELWDNLTDGKTIGTAVNATFVPGKGVLLPTFESHVTYTLQSTLTSGNIQFMIENLGSDTNGGKTKIVSMQQGYTDITDNPYRFNVEKRGDDHVDVGKFRMRIITGNAATGFYDSARLLPSSLIASKAYHVSVTWGGGTVRLVVREGSDKGTRVLDGGFTYQGTYRPNPHVVHIGAPVPRGGPLDATVPGILVRYFHVSKGAQWPGSTLLGQLGGLFTEPGSGN